MKYLFLIAFFMLSGCATSPSSNKTYGTELTARNNEINLSLAPDYPYLSNLNSGLKLRATYQVKGQRVTEVVATSRLQGTSAVFVVPETLSAIPDNQVCFQVEPMTPIQIKQGKISILPIRRVAQSAGENAVAFRYPAWEANAKNSTLLKEKERELFRLESLLGNKISSVDEGSASTCDNLRVKEVVYEEPYIKDKSKFEEESKLVCTWRAQSFIKSAGNNEEEADKFMNAFNMKYLTGNLTKKGETLQHDWKVYSPIVRKLGEDVKRFGRPFVINEKLLIGVSKYNGNFKQRTQEEYELDIKNIMGQYADLYDVCRRDVYVQLENKLAAWNQRRNKQQHEDEELLKLAIAECRANVKNKQIVDEKTKNLAIVVEQKKKEVEVIRSVQKEASDQSVKLNNIACTQ